MDVYKRKDRSEEIREMMANTIEKFSRELKLKIFIFNSEIEKNDKIAKYIANDACKFSDEITLKINELSEELNKLEGNTGIELARLLIKAERMKQKSKDVNDWFNSELQKCKDIDTNLRKDLTEYSKNHDNDVAIATKYYKELTLLNHIEMAIDKTESKQLTKTEIRKRFTGPTLDVNIEDAIVRGVIRMDLLVNNDIVSLNNHYGDMTILLTKALLSGNEQ